MELVDVAGTLRKLANGQNPITEEALAEDHLCRDASVVQALSEALKILERRAAVAKNTGRSWSGDEEQQLCERYAAGTPVPDIAKAHERSRAAIVARLVKLGKIAPDASEATSLRYRAL